MNELLCVSGGLDSYVAWLYLGKPKTIFFNCGHKYAVKELSVVKELMPDTYIDNTLKLGQFEEGEKAYIHCRNLLFAIQASQYINEGGTVWMAGLKDDVVQDKDPVAFELMGTVITLLSKKSVSIKSPFWHMTKADIVKWGLSAVSLQELLNTTSCYHPSDHYCGRCPSCFRKWVAFKVNGHDLSFYNDDLKEEYLTKALEGEYCQDRCDNIIKAIV